MKKVYIPTEEDIAKLNSLGLNTYNYLLSKVTETLIMEDVIYEDIDMFEYVYKNLSEYPEILYSISRMYPERIVDSELASKDINLCRKLTEKLPHQDNSIYHLDTITYFNQELPIVADPVILKNVVKILSDKLLLTPRYRFDYKEPNTILDNLFACELPKCLETSEILSALISIDPIYATKLDITELYKIENKIRTIPFELSRGMFNYNHRYGMETEIKEKDIQIKKSKKLIRCLEERKTNFTKIYK